MYLSQEWHRSGPPRSVRLFLTVPVVSMVLCKGLIVMTVWLYIKSPGTDPRSTPDSDFTVSSNTERSAVELAEFDATHRRDSWDMWSAMERLLATVVALLSLLFYWWLDTWQLIGYRW